MSYLVGNPEDRFSHDEVQICLNYSVFIPKWIGFALNE